MHKKFTKGDVFEFVKKELVPANNTRVECADGRYTPEQSQGAIRAFGGDFGMVMAFAGALKDEGTFLDPDEIVVRYHRAAQAVRGGDTKLYYHSDSHNHSEGKIGCGHAALAWGPENDGLYGSLTYQDVQNLYKSFSHNPNADLTVLEGHHKEKGVLVVQGKGREVSHSVNSRNKKSMYFVVDATRIDRFIDSVVSVFSQGLLRSVNSEDVKANYKKQQDATAKLLGADKLPFYRVGVDENGQFTMEQIRKRRLPL